MKNLDLFGILLGLSAAFTLFLEPIAASMSLCRLLNWPTEAKKGAPSHSLPCSPCPIASDSPTISASLPCFCLLKHLKALH